MIKNRYMFIISFLAFYMTFLVWFRETWLNGYYYHVKEGILFGIIFAFFVTIYYNVRNDHEENR